MTTQRERPMRYETVQVGEQEGAVIWQTDVFMEDGSEPTFYRIVKPFDSTLLPLAQVSHDEGETWSAAEDVDLAACLGWYVEEQLPETDDDGSEEAP
ncbi:MAG TPA: hypothetical protein VD948_05105 [Rhodothermales bacterium]|nr:hypothetical protein [Rhodothermales bacterium]